MKQSDIFVSPQGFRDGFAAGLEGLLEREGLGGFILVCANAFADPDFLARMRPRLASRFAALADEYRAALRAGRRVAGDPEDLLVWLKMLSIGFEALSCTEYRRSGDWEVQFNLLRSFRPRRMGEQAITCLQRPFDPNGFSFNKSFMLQEIFWSGALQGRAVDLYYNKYPFVDLHGLLVLERERQAPQFLTTADHAYLWNLADALGAQLPGLGFGYNSVGAFASVNHQHFQLFVREQPLPVAEAHWRHNGGARDYPLPCLRLTSAAEAWEAIAALHGEQTAYNLLYLPGCLYLLPRRMQGSYTAPDWTTGFSWYELCGGFITFNRDDYLALTPDTLAGELGRLALPA
jgi:hypothetical protein